MPTNVYDVTQAQRLALTAYEGLEVYQIDTLKGKYIYSDGAWCMVRRDPETYLLNTEYVSPEQHGNLYGTVYRQYFNASLPAALTSGNNVAMLIDYAIRYVTSTNRGVVRGWSADGTNSAVITLTGTSGKGNLLLTLTGAFAAAWLSWVDYTK